MLHERTVVLICKTGKEAAIIAFRCVRFKLRRQRPHDVATLSYRCIYLLTACFAILCISECISN